MSFFKSLFKKRASIDAQADPSKTNQDTQSDSDIEEEDEFALEWRNIYLAARLAYPRSYDFTQILTVQKSRNFTARYTDTINSKNKFF